MSTLSAGIHRITLEVTDSRGATGTEQFVFAVDGPVDGRAYADRPDEVSGNQVHLVYAVPCASQADWDLDGRIAASFWRLQRWVNNQAGAGWRIDTFDGGRPDITFVRLCEDWSDSNGLLSVVLSAYYARSTRTKLLAVYTTVPLKSDIPNRAGSGRRGIGLVSAAVDDLSASAGTTGPDRIMVHELLHGIGIAHTCVQGDLMWGLPECDGTGTSGGLTWDVRGGTYESTFVGSPYTMSNPQTGPSP